MKSSLQILANYLKENGLTIALAESITCGFAAHKLGTIPNTSDIFMGGIVCYNEKVKTKLLKVKKTLIKEYTAESQEVTDALATNLSKLMSADIHAAITGLAAPGESVTKGKPVGTVFYSFLFNNKLYRLKKKFNGTPTEIREKAAEQLFKFINQQLKQE